MSSELNIIENLTSDPINITLSGEIDIYTAPELKEKIYKIADSHKSDLQIDCADLEYIDSTGLGIFVGALKKVKSYDKQIYIVNLKENIKKLFVLTGLEKLFVIK